MKQERRFELVTKCAEAYMRRLRTEGTRWDTLQPYTDEFAFTLMSACGYGASYQRILGAVNDIANGAGLNLDLERLQQQHNRLSLSAQAKQWFAQKDQLQGTISSVDENNTTATLPNHSECSTVYDFNNSYSTDHTQQLMSSFLSRDNDLFLQKAIQCPTFILHSPDDGRASFAYHARHAAATIANTKLIVRN